MTKGIIYYTDNQLEEPIFSICQKHIRDSGLSIVSTSLKPVKLGLNIVIEKKRSYATMVEQIMIALANLNTDVVFFCEHDVLYPKCHFDFTPEKEDIYYYNNHIWRWDYPKDRLITYKGLVSLSGLCSNRKLVLKHYIGRYNEIVKNGYDKLDSKEPVYGRKWGYEPGTKKKKRGGYSDEDFDVWTSKIPIIDIRHENTYTRTKVTLDSFKHPPDPSTWKETTLDEIVGWNIKSLFNI
jgi:hypothetical protein